MNVSTITMDPKVARAKLVVYREQLRRRHDEEYRAAVTGYELLAAGTPLLNLMEVFAQTGLGSDGRPKLAIARSDRRQVEVNVRRGRITFDATAGNFRGKSGYQGSLIVDVIYSGEATWKDGYALIPMVPADIRPNDSLTNYFTLWEVEQWADSRIRAVADRDPYLLRHVIGDLYAVIAEWELTELERAIMAGRRNG